MADYNEMNVEDLQKLARERNVEGRSTMDKSELVSALERTDAQGSGDATTAHVATGGDLNNPVHAGPGPVENPVGGVRGDTKAPGASADVEAPQVLPESEREDLARRIKAPDSASGNAMREEDRKLATEGDDVDDESRTEVDLTGARRVQGTEQFEQPPHSTPDSESLQAGGVKTDNDEQ